jgi:hypothetical protein
MIALPLLFVHGRASPASLFCGVVIRFETKEKI